MCICVWGGEGHNNKMAYVPASYCYNLLVMLYLGKLNGHSAMAGH